MIYGECVLMVGYLSLVSRSSSCSPWFGWRCDPNESTPQISIHYEESFPSFHGDYHLRGEPPLAPTAEVIALPPENTTKLLGHMSMSSSQGGIIYLQLHNNHTK